MSESIEAARIAQSPRFSSRCALLAMKTAIAVAYEDPATEGHDGRIRLANLVLKGLVAAPLVAGWVMTNGTVRSTAVADKENMGAAVPDGDIEFVLASVWTAVGTAYLDGAG
jgi:hypothetical protein